MYHIVTSPEEEMSRHFRVAFFPIALLAAGCSGNNATPAQQTAPLILSTAAQDTPAPTSVDYRYSFTNRSPHVIDQGVLGSLCMIRTVPNRMVASNETATAIVETSGNLFDGCAKAPSWFMVEYKALPKADDYIKIEFKKVVLSDWVGHVEASKGNLFYCKGFLFGPQIDGYIQVGKGDGCITL
jgi:hypothetical protein